MKKNLTLIAFFAFITIIAHPVFAAESSPSAATKSKLQSLQEEISSRASRIKQDIGKKLQNRVFVGFIKTKSENSLTLATKEKTKMVNINEYTIYGNSGKTKTTLKSLTSDDYIVALGDIDDNEVLTAKMVVKVASSSATERKALFGQVLSAADETITLQKNDGKNTSISVDDNTSYQLGKSTGTFSDIRAGKPVITVGETLKSGVLKARFVYIFPYAVTTKTKVSTSSAAEKKSP